MKIRCSRCGEEMDDIMKRCPNCGEVNRRTDVTHPQTVDELKAWYEDRHLPPYVTTRFFIGEDYRGARAFGIYEENGVFTVYKNKDDGSRAIRYRGEDEAHAVNELFLKLKSEILNQRSLHGDGERKTDPAGSGRRTSLTGAIGLICGMTAFSFRPLLAALVIGLPWLGYYLLKKSGRAEKLTGIVRKACIIYLAVVMLLCIGLRIAERTPHYYSYDDSVYCSYAGSYYYYDPFSDDYEYIYDIRVPREIIDHGGDYRIDKNDAEWSDGYSFRDSDYYAENFSSDSDSDSDSDYDWDNDYSWDSGGTDWSSDW